MRVHDSSGFLPSGCGDWYTGRVTTPVLNSISNGNSPGLPQSKEGVVA